MTVEQAARFLAEQTGSRRTAEQILGDPEHLKWAYRWAALVHHPDRGGDAAIFRRVTAARDLQAAADG